MTVMFKDYWSTFGDVDQICICLPFVLMISLFVQGQKVQN